MDNCNYKQSSWVAEPEKDSILIIDFMNLFMRGYHGFGKNQPGLTELNGFTTTTGTSYYFLRQLLMMIEHYTPANIIIAMEGGKTFRNSLYPEYKGERKQLPIESKTEVTLLKMQLDRMGFDVIEQQGCEADDVIYTVVSHLLDTGREILIHSTDKDILQCLSKANPQIKIINTLKSNSSNWQWEGNYSEAGYNQAIETFGVLPVQIAAFKAIAGDPSDNIPGIPGVGPKAAQKLLEAFGNLDNILAAVNESYEKFSFAGELKVSKHLYNIFKEYSQQVKIFEQVAALAFSADLVAKNKLLQRLADKQDKSVSRHLSRRKTSLQEVIHWYSFQKAESFSDLLSRIQEKYRKQGLAVY